MFISSRIKHENAIKVIGPSGARRGGVRGVRSMGTLREMNRPIYERAPANFPRRWTCIAELRRLNNWGRPSQHGGGGATIVEHSNNHNVPMGTLIKTSFNTELVIQIFYNKLYCFALLKIKQYIHRNVDNNIGSWAAHCS